eukprot:281058-Amphidinium_carterae.1
MMIEHRCRHMPPPVLAVAGGRHVCASLAPIVQNGIPRHHHELEISLQRRTHAHPSLVTICPTHKN